MSKAFLPVTVAVALAAGVVFLAYTSVGAPSSGQFQELRAKLSDKAAAQQRKATERAEDEYYHTRGGHEVCGDPDFSKNTLKSAIPPRPFAGLFLHLKGQRKFEASDVIRVARNGVDQFYVVFDNLFSIARLDSSIPIHDERNVLIGTPGVDSGYEAIVYDNVSDTFFVTVEAVSVGNAMRIHDGKPVDEKDDAAPYVSVVRELKLPSEGNETPHDPISCPVGFPFPSANKGFEGMFLHRIGAAHSDLFLFGLCEGNNCAGGKEGREAGNGRLVLLHWRGVGGPKGHKPPKSLEDAKCWWDPIRTIKLPKEIGFLDYSAIAFNPTTRDVAISSQENAAVWVGKVDLDGTPDKWHVKSGGKIYHFPRDGNCRITNCNVEGLAWVGENVLAAVSDKMKSRGAQDFRCLQADQSFQQFVLP